MYIIIHHVLQTKWLYTSTIQLYMAKGNNMFHIICDIILCINII